MDAVEGYILAQTLLYCLPKYGRLPRQGSFEYETMRPCSPKRAILMQRRLRSIIRGSAIDLPCRVFALKLLLLNNCVKFRSLCVFV